MSPPGERVRYIWPDFSLSWHNNACLRIIREGEKCSEADKSAMGTINRPLLVASHFLVQVGLMYKRPFFATAITYSWHRPGMDHSAYFTFPAIEHYRPVLWE